MAALYTPSLSFILDQTTYTPNNDFLFEISDAPLDGILAQTTAATTGNIQMFTTLFPVGDILDNTGDVVINIDAANKTFYKSTLSVGLDSTEISIGVFNQVSGSIFDARGTTGISRYTPNRNVIFPQAGNYKPVLTFDFTTLSGESFHGLGFTDDITPNFEGLIPQLLVIGETLESTTSAINVDNSNSSDIAAITENTTASILVRASLFVNIAFNTDDVVVNLIGGNNVKCSFDVNLESTTITLDASYAPQARIQEQLDPITPLFDGNVIQQGAISTTLDNISAIVNVDVVTVATISESLEPVNPDVIGNMTIEAVLAETLIITPDIRGSYSNLFCEINVTTDNATGVIAGEYDSNVLRYVVNDSPLEQQAAIQTNTGKLCLPVEATVLKSSVTCIDQDGTSQIINDTCLPKEIGTIINAEYCENKQDALKNINAECMNRDNGIVVNIDVKSPFDNANNLDDNFCIPSGDLIDLSSITCIDVDVPEKQFKTYHLLYDEPISTGTAARKQICQNVEEARRPPNGITPLSDIPPPPVDPDPPNGNVITYNVPIRNVYKMINTITSTLADGVTVVHLDNVNLNLDVDSHSWQFSAVLLEPSQKSLIIQNADGSAKIIHVTINGYVWHLLIEEIVTNRVFGNQSISISGRGISSLLSSPYQRKESLSQGALIGVQQLADLIMPFGWVLNWTSPTWNVSAGAYSYSNLTTIEAIRDIATKIGSIVVPSRTAQELTIKPRYPVLPWNFALVSPDVSISDAAISSLSERPTSTFQANGVYVHGEDLGGLLALVKLNGTAGDRLGQTTFNSLMTDTDGLRALGERLLAKDYVQPSINSITTFMDGVDVPLFELGDFIEFNVDSVATRGIINSISISAKHEEVTQSVTIGEKSSNIYVEFKDIVPIQPTLVGEINSVSARTALVTLTDGGVQRVKGTGTIGNNVYINDGEIIADAPTLPTSTITV